MGDEEFLKLRKRFLKEQYKVSEKEYQEKFIDELEKLAAINNYDEIVLWFEFDLFSHMNMLGLISFLIQNKKQDPLYLVCSKKLKGEKEMAPLSQLSTKYLKQHYNHRFQLTEDDISTAQLIWELYCSRNPQRLLSEIKKTTNFEYLASSIRTHIERFPSATSGLNSLERQILKLIKTHPIKSRHHLLGYALEYQGYYGYVDVQMERVMKKMEPFFEVNDHGVTLNEDGQKALDHTKNYYQKLKDRECFGGVAKYDFLYDPDTHNLLKL